MSAMRPSVVTFSDVDEQTELWLARLREMKGRSAPRTRTLTLWCDHESQTGLEEPIAVTGRPTILWQCDGCGDVTVDDRMWKEYRLDQIATFGAEMLRGPAFDVRAVLQQAVMHHYKVAEAERAKRGAWAVDVRYVVRVETTVTLAVPE